MPLDDLVLALQGFVDRVVRRLRIGARAAARAPAAADRADRRPLARRARAGAARGRMPFLARLLRAVAPPRADGRRHADLHARLPDGGDVRRAARHPRASTTTTSAGAPTSTSRARATPRGWKPSRPRGRRGILTGGSTYGCVFTGGAANNLFSFAMLKRPSGRGVLTRVSAFVVLGLGRRQVPHADRRRASCDSCVRIVADPAAARARADGSGSAIKVGMSVWMRAALHARRSRATSTPACPPSTSTTSTTTSTPTPSARGTGARGARCAGSTASCASSARVVPARAGARATTSTSCPITGRRTARRSSS